MNQHDDQLYCYTLYELSAAQRQLILLTTTSIAYTVIMGGIYSWLEGWDWDDGLYWTVVTLTTIGFGDFAPKTVWGKMLVLPLAPVGIGLVAANIYAIRLVVLEMLTEHLASHYSKAFGIIKERPFSETPLFGRHARSFSSGSILDPHSLAPQSDPATPRRPSDPEPTRPLSIRPERHSLPDLVASSAPVLPDSSTTLSPPPDPDAAIDFPIEDPAFRHHIHRSLTTSVIEAPRTLVISRSGRLPQLTIVAGSDLRRHHVLEATHRTVRRQIMFAVWATLANVVVGIFYAGVVDDDRYVSVS
ncbi:hypothetical protein BDK51DRAFT_50442 [Blyttiomyces helicus]|uniref:Potassium channel domain-containing protein n=1 Tax=Blyttiomyces helicus TaxID=388810 RepID=A0A4V1IQG0_9FUNG|nr:hypothetical protein BDK51DRAFT_50442 [Blyttiomyces helicus]|eukprot:RKO86427.1 hypothetical protein BDK51DRAFT_50442 [Blyttiomyces helicus]